MAGTNAVIDVGKHNLDIVLGSNEELFSDPNQARTIARLARRLAKLGCVRVLIEGGSYQNASAALRQGESDRPRCEVLPMGGLMLVMEEAVKIRVLSRQEKSIRAIARALGVSRNTVVCRYLPRAATFAS